MADDGPWHGFVTFVEGVLDLQVHDRRLGDATTLAHLLPTAPARE